MLKRKLKRDVCYRKKDKLGKRFREIKVRKNINIRD